MSLTEDVLKLMSPTDEDGRINILYADSYYRMSLEERYGKAAVDRECNRLSRRAALEYYLDDSKQKTKSGPTRRKLRLLSQELDVLRRTSSGLRRLCGSLLTLTTAPTASKPLLLC